MFKKLFGQLQRIGETLMSPVAILPVAELLLAVGTAFRGKTLQQYLPFIKDGIIQNIANMMTGAGSIIFDNLPIIFALGIAVGLTDEGGVAAIAAFVGLITMNKTMGAFLNATPAQLEDPSKGFINALGVPTFQTEVFGGIIIGALAAWCYNKSYNISLPSYLGFFAGKRFAPIVMVTTSFVLAFLMAWIRPFIQNGLSAFSIGLLGSDTGLAVFLFGFIKRLLILFNLHHIFHAPSWLEFGSRKNAAGEVIRGNQRIFIKQIHESVHLTSGGFMQGEFPAMMFRLPTAASAICQIAKPKNKKVVGGLMLSAALASFLTGITELLESSFLFVAPLLLFIHIILDGLSFLTLYLLHLYLGCTFSGGFIDFVLLGILSSRTPWWLVIPVGLVYAIICYIVFRFLTVKFNFETSGHEGKQASVASTSASKLPFDVLDVMGGKKNIEHLDVCITHLHVEVSDKSRVNVKGLKALGASGVLEVGNNMQAIFGSKSDQIKHDMARIMSGDTTKPSETIVAEDTLDGPVQLEEVKGTDIYAPGTGHIIPLSEVPDRVFSEKMMGDGIGLVPEKGRIVTPFDGIVKTVFPMKHTIGLESDTGIEVLVHIGIDTVKLNGEGFESLVDANEPITQGQLLMKINLVYLKEHALGVATPAIITNQSDKTLTFDDVDPINTDKRIVTIK